MDQFRADDHAALAVEGDLLQIGRHRDGILHAGNGRRHVFGRGRGLSGDGLLDGGFLMHLFGVEEGRLALVNLIVVPKEEAGGKQNDPQKGSLQIFSHRTRYALWLNSFVPTSWSV